MQYEEKIVHKECDICHKKVDHFADVNETRPMCVRNMNIDIWYGKRYVADVCRECSDQIVKLIKQIKKDNGYG